MKKLKLLSLILAMVIIATTFSACGIFDMFTSLDKVFNKKYNPIEAPVNSLETLTSEVQGSTFVEGNAYFAVFKSSLEDGFSTYRVYSFATDSVVYNANSSATRGYDIDLYDNIPAFGVKETTLSADSAINIDIAPKCSLYDANGNEVASYNQDVAAPVKIADMYVYNYKAYVENSEGVLEEKMDVPEYLMINNVSEYNDKYIYTKNNGMVIYDTDFKVVSFWNAPGYAEEIEYFVLNNGDVLVQYLVRLDDMDEKYDIMQENELGGVDKYDLVSLVIKAKNGNEKKLKVDYVVNAVIANSDLYDEEDTNNMFTDKFENIANISYIVDGRVDSSPANDDVVIMGNNGKVKTSLKVTEAQKSTIPMLVADGVYAAQTTYGMALINAKGKVLQAINNTSVNMNGKYIVTDKAIYDLKMEVVYDLSANNAELVGALGDTLFVKIDNGTGKSIAAVRNGSNEFVCSLDTATFEVREAMGCYEVADSSGNYKYYNANGDMMTASTSRVNVLATSEDENAIIIYDGTTYSMLRK